MNLLLDVALVAFCGTVLAAVVWIAQAAVGLATTRLDDVNEPPENGSHDPPG